MLGDVQWGNCIPGGRNENVVSNGFLWLRRLHHQASSGTLMFHKRASEKVQKSRICWNDIRLIPGVIELTPVMLLRMGIMSGVASLPSRAQEKRSSLSISCLVPLPGGIL